MVLRMVSLVKRNGSDNWHYRRTIPADVQRILAKLPNHPRPKGWYKTHILISTRTADRTAAKAKAADIAADVERQLKALREGPKALTAKQVSALSGIAYRAFAEGLEDNLVIAKLDRLSRNQSFLMALIDSGVDVLFCDLPQIPAGAVGRFMLQQMSAVAELEAGLISERTKAALAAKVARDGQRDRKAKHHLVAGVGQKAATEAVRARAAQRASDLAPIIAEIRKAGADSLREIAKALTERGIPQPSGGAGAWSAVQVSRTMARL